MNCFALLTAGPAKEGMGKVAVEGAWWFGLETRECETSSDTLVGRRGSGGGCGCGRGAQCCKLASGQSLTEGEEKKRGQDPLSGLNRRDEMTGLDWSGQAGQYEKG